MSNGNLSLEKAFIHKIKSFLLSDLSTHILIWTIFYFISLDFFLQYLPLISLNFPTEKIILFCTVYIIFFVPIPYLILRFRKRIESTALYLIFSFLFIILISPVFTIIDYIFISGQTPEWFFSSPHLFSRVVYLIILTFIIHWVNYRSKYKEEQHQKERAERLKKQAELNMLVSQISPHFLFNILNNLNSLIYQDQDLASEQVVKISTLLRYVIYEGKRNTVSITEEITYLENYVYLCEKQKKFNQVSFTKNVNHDHQIQPLLFINFVENAFKHCQLEDKDYISIGITVNEGAIKFQCVNTFDPESKIVNSHRGMGLSNTLERLKIAYPNRFNLNTNIEKSLYSVNLEIIFEI